MIQFCVNKVIFKQGHFDISPRYSCPITSVVIVFLKILRSSDCFRIVNKYSFKLEVYKQYTQ